MNTTLALLLISLICLSAVRGTEENPLLDCFNQKCNNDSTCILGIKLYSDCLKEKCNSGDEEKDATCMLTNTECAKTSNEASVKSFNLCMNEMIQAELAKSGSSILSVVAIVISAFFLMI